MAIKQSPNRKKTPGITPELQKAMEYFKEADNLLSPPITRAAYSDRMAWVLASMAHLAYLQV
jgi:hypothetical protein